MAEDTDWQDVDLEQVDKQLKDYQDRNDRQLAKRPPKGRSIARGLPPRKDKKPTPMVETYVHFIHHPSGGELMFVGECPLKTGKGPYCAACKKVGEWKRSPDPALKKAADEMGAKWHAYLAVVYLMHPERKDLKLKEAQPEVVDVPRAIYEKLMKAYRDPQLGGNWSHPDKGYDLVFDRTGEGKNDTKYDVTLARQSTPLMNRDWLKKLPDLDAVAGQFQNDQVEALFRGEVEAPGAFPPGPESQKALPPPSTNADGTWTHPSLQGIPPAPGQTR